MSLFHSGGKVKGYTLSSRSGRHVLKVELEYEDPYELAYDMKQLDEAREAQKPQKKPRRQPPLALPHPEEF